MIGGLSLLYPVALIGLPAGLAALVYLYRQQGQQKIRQIATLFFLEGFTSTPKARRKFIPPLRFFFELLLLTLLVAGITGLYFKNDGKRYAILIDTSLSMSAIDDGTSLFKLAIDEAAAFTDDLSIGSVVEVWESSPVLKSLMNGPVNSERAAAVISGLHPTYAEDHLDQEIERLKSRGGYDHIVVFTDHPKGKVSSSLVDIKTVSPSQRTRNISILNISFDEHSANTESDNASGRRLQVKILNNSDRKLPVRVEVEEVNALSDSISTRDITSRSVDLDPEKEETVSFSMGGSTARLFHVVIKNLGSPTNDSILYDNDAWVSSAPVTTKILLVGNTTPEKIGADHIPGLEIVSGSYPPIDKDISGVIFSHAVPDDFPSLPSAIIAPPPGSSIFPASPVSSTVPLARWEASHPLTRYLYVPGITLPSSEVLTPPVWAEPFLWSSKGAVAYSGIKNNIRVAVIGFEILPYEGKKSPTISILTLNIFKWLFSSGSGESGETLKTFDRPGTFNNASIKYLSPVSEAVGGTAPTTELPVPGIVLATSLGSQIFGAVNFFNEDESKTFSPTPISVSDSTETSFNSSGEIPTLGIYLAALLFLLLAGDLLFQLRKRKKQKRPSYNAAKGSGKSPPGAKGSAYKAPA